MKQKMMKSMVIGMMVVTGLLHAASGGFKWGGSQDEVAFFDAASAQIEKRVSHGKIPQLDKLYKELFYAPMWIKAGGVSPFGKALLRLIRTDKTVTKSLPVYAENQNVRQQVKDLVNQKGGTLEDKVSLELAMSKLYLHYAQYRIYGGIKWVPFAKKLQELSKKYKSKVGWVKYRPKATPVSILNDALNDGNLARAFHDADPRRFGYAALRKKLIEYIDIAKRGGWSKLPRFSTIKPGGSNPRIIPLIRKHLSLTGDLQGCSEPMKSPKYDPCLAKAVSRFQLRHGLRGGSIIGPKTRAALNVTVTQAIQKIRLNLDRIKWLYHKQTPMRIELNIPSFRLNFFNGDKLVTTIRVVTGKPDHPTPSFHNTMSYIVVNPYWKIPEGIVRNEMLPKLIRDPYHYEAQGKELHESWDENSPRVDPGTVDWAQYRDPSKRIPYYFMQVPGRHNALGKIKFLFPNGYSVYIHDTPSKNLFFRNVRAFSHGCMRIQKPRELLESLALFNDNINVDEVMELLKGTEKKTIVLKHKVPIDITYLTAYIDPYGYLNFRKDVYHYDKYQLKHYTPKVVSLKEKGYTGVANQSHTSKKQSSEANQKPLKKGAAVKKDIKPYTIELPKTSTAVKPVKVDKPNYTVKPAKLGAIKVSSPDSATVKNSSTKKGLLPVHQTTHKRAKGDEYQVIEIY